MSTDELAAELVAMKAKLDKAERILAAIKAHPHFPRFIAVMVEEMEQQP